MSEIADISHPIVESGLWWVISGEQISSTGSSTTLS
jgi:hypothetical protein